MIAGLALAAPKALSHPQRPETMTTSLLFPVLADIDRTLRAADR
jgi:hypothetical protein